MNRKKIYKIIIKLITGLCLVVYFTISGIIGIKTVKASSLEKTTIEYKIENKNDIDKNIIMVANNKTNQYGEKNMLTGKVSGELACHNWYLNRLNNLARGYDKKINIFSGYRSYELQQQLFNNSNKSGKMVAPPGRSRHQVGLAVDIDSVWVTKLNNEQLAPYGLYKPMTYENWHIEPVETKGMSTQELIAYYGTPSDTQILVNNTEIEPEAKSNNPNEEINIFKSLIQLAVDKEITRIETLKTLDNK